MISPRIYLISNKVHYGLRPGSFIYVFCRFESIIPRRNGKILEFYPELILEGTHPVPSGGQKRPARLWPMFPCQRMRVVGVTVIWSSTWRSPSIRGTGPMIYRLQNLSPWSPHHPILCCSAHYPRLGPRISCLPRLGPRTPLHRDLSLGPMYLHHSRCCHIRVNPRIPCLSGLSPRIFRHPWLGSKIPHHPMLSPMIFHHLQAQSRGTHHRKLGPMRPHHYRANLSRLNSGPAHQAHQLMQPRLPQELHCWLDCPWSSTLRLVSPSCVDPDNERCYCARCIP